MLIKLVRHRILDYFIYLILFVWFFFDFLLSYDAGSSLLVQLLFLLIGILSYIGVISDARFVSVNKIIYLFLFIFMFYTPFHQYLERTSFWGIGVFEDEDYLYANLIVLLFMGTYAISYRMIFCRKKVAFIRSAGSFCITNLVIFMLMAVSVIAVLLLLSMGELISVTDDSTDGGSFYTVFLKILRYTPVSSILICGLAYRYHLYRRINFLTKLYLTVIGICFIIVFFPLNGSISRYLLFGTYLTVIALFCGNFRHPSLLLVAVFIGFALIFPAFNFFKTHTIADLAEFEFGGFDATFNDYDAHYLLMCTMKYVRLEGITYGQNLLTALFCFIPRSIWSGKSLASGAIISSYLGARFTNVSCPLFAEFFLAFHIPGVIVCTILFVALIKLLEAGIQRKNIFYEAIYYMVLGLMMATMRGSLLPFASFTFSLILSFFACYLISILLGHKKKRLSAGFNIHNQRKSIAYQKEIHIAGRNGTR